MTARRALLAVVVAVAGCGNRSAPPQAITIPSGRGTAPAIASAPAASSAAEAAPDDAWDACPPLPGIVRPADVTQVDWCSCGGLSRFGTMKACHAELHEYESLGGPHDTSITRVLDVAYGDLDGDGVAEAVVPVLRIDDYARAGTSHERGTLFVYGVRPGGVRRLVELATRPPERVSIDGGVVTLRARGGCVERLRLQTVRGEPKLAPISAPCP